MQRADFVLDLDLDADDALDFDLDEPAPPVGPLVPERAPSVLVLERDPDTAAGCVRNLRAMKMRPVVVTTVDEARDRLRREEPRVAVLYLDFALRDLEAEARDLLPGVRVLLATDEVGDVLTPRGVVLCRPFTDEEFRRAFDSALVEDPLREVEGWLSGADVVWPEDASDERLSA